MDSDSYITLTGSGMEIANHTYERHKHLPEFFVHLGVDEKPHAKTHARRSTT